MPAVRKSRRSVEEQVRAELQQIRAQVAGVRGSLVATSDGLVVAHDIPDVEPTQIAALAAATLAVARRATLATECGPSARPWPAAATDTSPSTRPARARSWPSSGPAA